VQVVASLGTGSTSDQPTPTPRLYSTVASTIQRDNISREEAERRMITDAWINVINQRKESMLNQL
jgi:hypothetical protein